MPSSPALSVVIPAFNEAPRLGPSLNKVCAYLKERRMTYEVLLADDGSTDGTAAIAESFSGRGVRVLRTDDNRGKGAATRRGVLASRGPIVLLTDADLSTPMTELPKLETRLTEAAVVLGSRAVTGANVIRYQRLYRVAMGKVFNALIRLSGVRGISDTQCGFKLLDGDIARRIFELMVCNGFAFDVELVWLARKLGHQVAEVGVTWENSPQSHVHPLADPPRMLLEIALFRWRHRRRFLTESET